MTTAQTRARIKNATRAAQKNVKALDKKYLTDLKNLYYSSRDLIVQDIQAYAAGAESIRLDVLRGLLDQIDQRLAVLNTSRDALLGTGLREAANYGVNAWALELDASRLSVISDDAVRFVTSFVADDGIQLSERLWHINHSASEMVDRAVTQAVVRGQSATEAALEFTQRSQAVPASLAANASAATIGNVTSAASAALISQDGAFENALRVFRTEINRAFGVAYRESAFEHDDVIGTRFLLSPRHPRIDICDMHSKVNKYGLGPGVYPRGRSPWPAHPNTLSFEEAVFSDEVSDDDRKSKESRIGWLQAQNYDDQVAILGGKSKTGLLRSDQLKENQIQTPWYVLKARRKKAGHI